MALVDISTATFDLLKDLGLERAGYILKAKDIFKQLNFSEDDVVVLNFKDGVLTIGVFSSVWHQEMESMKDQLIKKLNELSSDMQFEKIIIKEIAYD
ncbi:hypothetical protein DESAMIL20_1157 [Desulfurella amilsii]|uniref:Uncharacterized protein n=1 Tax=Desulfurella amilsii TaxID=1562698 RepID=A0A1X4XVQ9_9BACT|nr:DUF721 domain-containing protein [Desulfurella amilsii]OSS41604.1 hypothetical protein DESAMIL20_1157 [Desulfurella amilsii]